MRIVCQRFIKRCPIHEEQVNFCQRAVRAEVEVLGNGESGLKTDDVPGSEEFDRPTYRPLGRFPAGLDDEPLRDPLNPGDERAFAADKLTPRIANMQWRELFQKLGNGVYLPGHRRTPWTRHGLNDTASCPDFAMHCYGARSAFSHFVARTSTHTVLSHDIRRTHGIAG